MNSINQQLSLLLKSAARAPRQPVGEAPFGLESQVLAQWRRPGATGDLAHLLMPLLRRAVFCACLLMLLSIAFSYRAITGGENEEVIIANSTVDLTLVP